MVYTKIIQRFKGEGGVVYWGQQTASLNDWYTELCVACSNQTQTARKCRQFSLQRRGLDPMLLQWWSSAVGGGPMMKQH